MNKIYGHPGNLQPQRDFLPAHEHRLYRLLSVDESRRRWIQSAFVAPLCRYHRHWQSYSIAWMFRREPFLYPQLLRWLRVCKIYGDKAVEEKNQSELTNHSLRLIFMGEVKQFLNGPCIGPIFERHINPPALLFPGANPSQGRCQRPKISISTGCDVGVSKRKRETNFLPREWMRHRSLSRVSV